MLKKSGSMKKQDASKIPGSEFNCNVIVVFATCGDQKWQWVQKGLSKLIRDGMAKPSPEFCRFLSVEDSTTRGTEHNLLDLPENVVGLLWPCKKNADS